MSDINIGAITEALNDKVDRDCQNIDTTTGEPYIAGLAMPSGTTVSLTAGASGTTYTAPANGYVCLSAGSSSSGYIGLDNQTGGVSSGTRGAWQTCFIVVKKNDVFGISYDGSLVNFGKFVFIYADGSESEAN